jgi:DNA-binding transcriptional regulator YiaG
MARRVKGPTMSNWSPERIKGLRAALGESQEEFADHFRVTVDAVRTWEQGKGRPSGPVTIILDQLSTRVRFESAQANSHARRKAAAAG